MLKRKHKKQIKIPKAYFLRQLRNKAGNLDAYFFNFFLTDESQCLYCGSEYKGNVIFSPNVQEILNKETNIFNNLLTSVYHFFIFTIYFMVVHDFSHK